MNRIDRLFAILLFLQKRRTVRAADLAQRFEITERTVYRDMSALMQLGVPVVSLPGVGYQMMEGFYLPPLIFTPDEATALFLGASMLIASGNFEKAAHDVKEKVSVILPERTRHTAQCLAEIIEFYMPKKSFHLDSPYLVQLREAIFNRQVIRIRYHSREGNAISEREVDPYGLIASQSAWYVHGYCHLREDTRSFRLDRVESLVVLNKHFSPHLTIPTQSTPEYHMIRIRVEADQAHWLRERQHYGFIGEETIEAGIVMSYQVETFYEIQSWILGWGASVEVLDPPTLRDAIFREAEAILKRR